MERHSLRPPRGLTVYAQNTALGPTWGGADHTTARSRLRGAIAQALANGNAAGRAKQKPNEAIHERKGVSAHGPSACMPTAKNKPPLTGRKLGKGSEVTSPTKRGRRISRVEKPRRRTE